MENSTPNAFSLFLSELASYAVPLGIRVSSHGNFHPEGNNSVEYQLTCAEFHYHFSVSPNDLIHCADYSSIYLPHISRFVEQAQPSSIMIDQEISSLSSSAGFHSRIAIGYYQYNVCQFGTPCKMYENKIYDVAKTHGFELIKCYKDIATSSILFLRGLATALKVAESLAMGPSSCVALIPCRVGFDNSEPSFSLDVFDLVSKQIENSASLCCLKNSGVFILI